jgi:hypothetical protein
MDFKEYQLFIEFSFVWPNSLKFVKGRKACFFLSTVELHLSGLIGTARHPDMQKIRIIGFFFENRLHWQFEVRPSLFSGSTCA